MNVNAEAKKMVKGVLTGFAYAMGVAAAKSVMTFVPLSGFNLSF